MLAIWNRRELVTVLTMQEQSDILSALRDAGLDYAVKVIDRSSPSVDVYKRQESQRSAPGSYRDPRANRAAGEDTCYSPRRYCILLPDNSIDYTIE